MHPMVFATSKHALVDLNGIMTRVLVVSDSRALRIACEQREGYGREMGKREPVGMAKDFDFEMPVICGMSKLTI